MSALARLRELPPELRNAGIAAAALALSLFLPWYQKSVAVRGAFVQENMSAFGVFSFVEAAVLLVAAGVLFLVWARSEGKAFHLPGGDGMAISIAGGWALLLLVWRLFDKPDLPGRGTTVGVQWGIFGAMLAAGALLLAGARVRAAHRPEPPLPAAEPEPAPPPPRRDPDRRPADPSAVTDVLRDRPAWAGEPPEPPQRAPRRSWGEDAAGDAPTRALPDEGDAPTRRLPPDDDPPTRRLPDDEDPPRRQLSDRDTAPTRRLDEPRDRLF
jgi:hypothetical protein